MDGTGRRCWGLPPGLAPLVAVIALVGSVVAEETLVPRELQVSERSARLQLAEWLGYREETRGEAIRIYEALLTAEPDSEKLVMALLNLYAANGNDDAVRALGDRYPGVVEASSGWWLLLADQALARGHLAEAREHLAEAELHLSASDPVLGELERRRLAWGDFNGVARRMDARLRQGRAGYEDRETLAEALNAAGRRTEAAAVLEDLLADEPPRDSSRLLRVKILHAAKRYEAALKESRLLLAERPDWKEARQLHVRLLIENPERLERELLEGSVLAEVEALWRRQEKDEARELLGQLAHSSQAESRLYSFWRLLLNEERSMQAFTEQLLAEYALDPWRLSEWAWRMSEYGRSAEGVLLMEAAERASGGAERFGMDLAELYAIAGRYEASVELYRGLLVKFPESSKLQMGLARVLSWSRRYDESLATYGALHARYPEDPEVLREMARVAGWAKKFSEAERIFMKLFSPGLDVRLGLVEAAEEPDYRELGEARPFFEYERRRASNQAVPPLPPVAAPEAVYATAAMDAETLYFLQRGAYLEYRAKRRLQDLRYRRAELLLTELVNLEPGNLEARFDLAQARCSLGLKRSRDVTYEALLQVEPLHEMANRALEISRIRHRPALAFRESWMEEDGDERLADMRIQLTEIGAFFYPGKQAELGVLFGHQRERTGDAGYERETARLLTLEGSAVFNADWRGSAGLRTKHYRRSELGRRTTGFFGLEGNFDDWLRPRIRWSREEVLANGQAREDGIFMKQVELGAFLVPDRRWEVDLHLHWNRFSDDNEQLAFGVHPRWMWTDHPRELRIFADLQYRDTNQASIFLFAGGVPDRVVHPYWTPQDYLGGNIGLHWRHDLKADPFCGNLEHYYEVRVEVGGGSDGNRGFGVEAAWVHDLGLHWRFELSGRLHRSRQWDATAFAIAVRRHF